MIEEIKQKFAEALGRQVPPVRDEPDMNNPDEFARELHRELLISGPRSKKVRKLMRVARKHPGPELERIHETKVNEYQRYHRETRVPSIWNAPERTWEWLADHFSLTPPKDVIMTLVYVVIVLVGLEFYKGRFASEDSPAAPRPNLAGMDFAVTPREELGEEIVERFDEWLAERVQAEVQAQLDSPEFQERFAIRIAQAMKQQGIDGELLKPQSTGGLFPAEIPQAGSAVSKSTEDTSAADVSGGAGNSPASVLDNESAEASE